MIKLIQLLIKDQCKAIKFKIKHAVSMSMKESIIRDTKTTRFLQMFNIGIPPKIISISFMEWLQEDSRDIKKAFVLEPWFLMPENKLSSP